MTLVDRELLARQMRTVVADSHEMVTLQRAIDVMNPGHPGASVHEVATAVLYSVLRGHEAHTSGALTRMNEAIGRTLGDLAALRRGESIGGRTSGMRAADLATVAMAMEELATLEQRIRTLMKTDPDGSWKAGLKAEIEASLMRPSALPTVPAGAAAVGKTAKSVLPSSIAEGINSLRDAIHGVSPVGAAIWASKHLPAAVGEAAHNLVVAAGGDVAAAVKTVLRDGGSAANDMVIAILWKEGRIGPSSHNLGSKPFDQHQRVVTGLDFEWKGQLAPGQPGKEITNWASDLRFSGVGLDGIQDGLVVDAKHVAGDVASSGHVLGGATERAPYRRWENGEPAIVDALDEINASTAAATPMSRSEREFIDASVVLKEAEALEQMRRQLDWARHNGLRGIRWVCNTAELAAHFEQLALRLEGDFRNMIKEFPVGGLKGGF